MTNTIYKIITKLFDEHINSLIMLCIYGLVFGYIHNLNKNDHFIIKQDLQEIVINNVDYLRSKQNISQKYLTSGISIIQNGNLHQFNAPCVGVDQYCQPYQITHFPKKVSIIFLWTKNGHDLLDGKIRHGFIKEIRDDNNQVIFTNKKIDDYISFLHEKFIIGLILEMGSFIPILWISIKLFLNMRGNE